jgi:undecaprenyl diphosphate synthase
MEADALPAASVIPTHLAVIMDGNGRWAASRGWPRVRGHEEGAKAVSKIVRRCGELGVEALTLYSFSTENWERPDDEVDALMTLLASYLTSEAKELMQRGVRFRAIGELARLPELVQSLIADLTTLTQDNEGLQLTLALSYGGRAELVQAMRKGAERVEAGELRSSDIHESVIAQHLYTVGLPDPDLVIRTSGEMRLSNFLLWQLAYAEIYVTDVLWPDFDEHMLDVALDEYGRRKRRFGKTAQQVVGGDAV